MVYLLAFSCLVFSCLRCSFAITMLTANCFLLLSSPSMTGLLPKDFLPARKCFSFDFDKFSTIYSFLCCVCSYFSNCVGSICLERKWTYQCLDLGPFGFPWCLDLGLFRLLVCFYIVIVFMLLSHAFAVVAMVRILHFSLVKELVLQVFTSKSV